MFDQSFNRTNLLRCIKKSEFKKNTLLYNEEEKLKQIEKSIELTNEGLIPESSFVINKVKTKEIYKLKSLHERIVIDKANKNLKRLYRVRQNDRDTIIKNLKSALSEGLEYRIYKLDINKFYESIDHDEITRVFNNEIKLNQQTKRVINILLSGFEHLGKKGVPRGISISSTISEIIMKPFDKKIQSNKCVYFYFRYVDDIIIITNRKESKNFIKEISEYLPTGLTFNKKKKQKEALNNISAVDIGQKQKLLLKLDYLGYEFKIYNPTRKSGVQPKSMYRDVRTDISPKKVKKIKSKIIKSFSSYNRNHDFELLLDRIKLLTSNFSLLDRNKYIKVMSGIYYNYKRVDSEHSESLAELDKFLKFAVLSNKGKVFSLVSITNQQKNTLLRQSFKSGFDKRAFIYFSATRQSQIQKAWINA